jgi:hypothetical protein
MTDFLAPFVSNGGEISTSANFLSRIDRDSNDWINPIHPAARLIQEIE